MGGRQDIVTPADPPEPEILSLAEGARSGPVPQVIRDRRGSWENPAACDHRGTVWVDRSTRTVECDKCGAQLDPIEMLFRMQEDTSKIQYMYKELREHKRKEREKAQKDYERRMARLNRTETCP
jgi:hypothetical protein